MNITNWQLDRHKDARMAYYRDVYRGSLRFLSGKAPHNKRIIVYCEQGIGDVIQMLRYIPDLIKDNEVTLHCVKSLHRLVKSQWNVSVLDKWNESLPGHDFHILSMDLPMIFPSHNNNTYISIDGTDLNLSQYSNKIGIAWEGNPDHPDNKTRSCPLKYFEKLSGTLFCMQNKVHSEALCTDCESLTVLGIEIEDFYDVAKLISQMEFIVSVDTSCLHLAAAMSKKTFGLLSTKCDPRWGKTSKKSVWYPSLQLYRQSIEDDWQSVFESLLSELN